MARWEAGKHWARAGLLLAAAVRSSPAQTSPPVAASKQSSPSELSPPQAISLAEALQRAEANEPTLAAAAAESRALAIDRTNARAALLPSVLDHNQAIYTEPNGVPASRIGQTTGAPSPIFIANNAVREYAIQAQVNETVGLQQIGAIRLADATAARAAAELEIQRRGLVTTVVTLYYQVGSAETKLAATERARDEAGSFVDMSQKREAAREVAHADVIKAQLQAQGRERDLEDAHLAAAKARIELGVLLFRDPATPYQTEAAATPVTLPDRAAIDAAARENSAEIRSAMASLKVSQAETYSAKAALLPDLAVNVTYGIDATTVSSSQVDPDGSRINNLGYSGSATLDIPLWDWLTSERKIKQARIREAAANVALTATQRRVLANLNEFYAEAEVASRQVASLDMSVRDSRESLRLTNLRYANGEGTALEVVDAENALTAAEIAQADGVVRYQVALAQLQTLTGRL